GTPPPASASAECRFGKPHSAAEPFPPRDANSAAAPQIERGEPRTGDPSNRGPHPAAERGLPPRRPLWGVVYEWLLVAGIVGYFGLLLLAQRGLVELALMWRATGDFDTWTILTTLLAWLVVLAVIGYSLVVAA